MTILLLRDVDRFDTVVFTVTFRDGNGDLADPSTVTFYTVNPLGEQAEYVYGSDSEAAKLGAGVYTLTYQPDVSGRWSLFCVGEGTVNQSTQARVQVNRDPVTIS